MNSKLFTVILTIFLTTGISRAQSTTAADSLSRILEEVTITADQQVTKLIGTTLVSTIAGSPLADLGNALDVLTQLPMIKVEDNTVKVIGRNNIEIFIDGRPMRDELQLQNILSSNLKKVELLLAPGAAFESSTQAVLKITTKRNFVNGLSLTDRFQIQRNRKWSVNDYLGLSYTTGNLEFFADGNINRNNSLAKGTTTNTLVYNGMRILVGSSQHNSYPTTTGVIKAGVNYAKKEQSFGAYYRYNPERGDFVNSGTEWVDNNPVVQREIDKRIRAHSHLVSAYYENTFARKYLIHFDGDFRQSVADNHTETTYPESANQDVRSTDRRKSTLWAGKLYLKFPVRKGEFTIGTQDSYTGTTLDFNMNNSQVEEYIPSSLTDARQTSAALFASWMRMYGNFSVSAGARYEYVDYDFRLNGKRQTDISRSDHMLTPDLSVGYAFNDNARISLSYKLSTVKPPYSQLSGSLNYVGIHEIEGGNPALRDERLNDIQLFGMWKGFLLQADFIRSHDSYAYVKQLYPAENLQLLMHPVNIDVAALSLYLVWNKTIRRWTPDVTIGMYKQWLSLDHIRYNRPIFSYYFDNVFSLPHGWTITANISGRTHGDMHTNRFGTTWFTMDASASKRFFNKSLTVKISATDIFNTTNHDWTMRTYGIFVDKRQSYDQRGVSLSITYNFQPRKSSYKGTAASESELKRLN